MGMLTSRFLTSEPQLDQYQLEFFAGQDPVAWATDVCRRNARMGLNLQAMRSAFFTNPASPAWNPDADFDGNNLVNFLDLQVMREQFFLPPGPSASGCN